MCAFGQPRHSAEDLRRGELVALSRSGLHLLAVDRYGPGAVCRANAAEKPYPSAGELDRSTRALRISCMEAAVRGRLRAYSVRSSEENI